MKAEPRVTGQLFTHGYLERGAAVQDSKLFRGRLGGYVQSALHGDHFKLSRYLKLETGLTVPVLSGQGMLFYKFEEFFATIPINYLLNVITLL